MIQNIDTLIASIDILEYDKTFKGLLCELARKKEEAKSQVKDNSFETVQINIRGMFFEVFPNGSRHHAYILHNDMYELKFANYRSTNEDSYPVYVKIKSACLWEHGYKRAWQIISELIGSIGQIITNKVTRIDLCCHTDKFNFKMSDIDNFVGRYRSDIVYRSDRNVSGFSFGTGASKTVMCRIYNKTLEVKQKNSKLWFFDIWKKQGLNIDNVWNIEFELGRKFFKQCNMETVENVFEHISSIWKYCTCEWLRYIDDSSSRKTRCNNDRVWSELQNVFNAKDSRSLVRKTERLNRDAEKLVPSIIGYITSYLSKKNIDRLDCKKLDIEDCMEDILSRGLQYLRDIKQKTFDEEVNRKSALLAV
ncbi:hypothetical protein PV797_06790 [Clostridiaceae bacterium M8S5]|nr:hypothetical protein PV797_06790 [Clostridiaceae bacterium M8S5]